MKIKNCKCGRERPVFVFDKKGRCDHCRMDSAQRNSKRYEPGWPEIRAERNRLLLQTDYWDNISWRARRSNKQLGKCDDYRNALRDLPENFKNASEVSFPKKPKI